ncbi:MAG: hypothetical protein M3R27_05805 [Bacteroidota bacterium]|nr:hypothetical protein [Bacteroidota bacterium]
MKNFYALIIFILLGFCSNAQQWEWAYNQKWITSSLTKIDKQGNVYTANTSKGTNAFLNGVFSLNAVSVVKLSSTGNFCP